MRIELSESEARLLKEFLMIQGESTDDNEALAQVFESVVIRIEAELRKAYVAKWQRRQRAAKRKEAA